MSLLVADVVFLNSVQANIARGLQELSEVRQDVYSQPGVLVHDGSKIAHTPCPCFHACVRASAAENINPYFSMAACVR